MGDREKLFGKAKAAPNSLRFSDLCKLAEEFGFRFDRQKGSHRIYKHDGVAGMMNFQDCHGKAVAYQVRQLVNFIEDNDLI